MPRSALTAYRSVPFAANEHLLTLGEAGDLLEMSKRTVRRRIDDGTFPVVRFSARRLRIDAARAVTIASDDGTAVTLEQLQAERLAALREAQRAQVLKRRRWQRLVARGVRFLAQRLKEPATAKDMFSVAEIARLCSPRTPKKKARTLHHVVATKQPALPAFRDGMRRRRIWVHWKDAVAYDDNPDARAAIVAAIVSRFIDYSTMVNWSHDGDFDLFDLRTEISRGFVAWLVAHPREVNSVR